MLSALLISEAPDIASLDEHAAAQLKAHAARIGLNGEAWIGEGVERVKSNDLEECPFCAQDLNTSPIIDHYRAYFSDEYRTLINELASTLSNLESAHDSEAVADFERSVRLLGERNSYWQPYVATADIEVDTAALNLAWREAVEQLKTAIELKQSAPLERATLSASAEAAVTAYSIWQDKITSVNQLVADTNLKIAAAKELPADGDIPQLARSVATLRATKARHTVEIDALCAEYLAEKQAKSLTEQLRNNARDQLRAYRENAFPAYEAEINRYLVLFNAGFCVDRVAAADTRGGPTCTYNVLINNVAVPVSSTTGNAGRASFRNTLSAGDRNTLALAFFFASLEQDPDLDRKIVIFDDPISSLDDHRSLTTVQELRRLSSRALQVILLSHKKPFLCEVWQALDSAGRTALQVVRSGTTSTLAPWAVEQDSVTLHDRQHAVLREYARLGGTNSREVAEAIRPVIESFLRVACPEHFPPTMLLGPFHNLCTQRLGTTEEILSATDTSELSSLIEYGNQFHHDTNPSWRSASINETELESFVRRTLAFARR